MSSRDLKGGPTWIEIDVVGPRIDDVEVAVSVDDQEAGDDVRHRQLDRAEPVGTSRGGDILRYDL